MEPKRNEKEKKMLESSIVSETSGIGAGKVLDKKAHFKAGAIDFTAGSLGIE